MCILSFHPTSNVMNTTENAMIVLLQGLDTPAKVILGLALLVVIGCTIAGAFGLVQSLINAITIWFEGYPPSHCDVEGKLKTNNGDDDEAEDT